VAPWSEDALLDEWLRLTHPLLLPLELALRLSCRDPKPGVDATDSDRGSRTAPGASVAVVDGGRSGSSLPWEKSSSATHMSPAPADTRPPVGATRNSKSSAASEVDLSVASQGK
jgi:hypothetical protein